MLCPNCQVANPDDAARCKRCGLVFADMDGDETLESSVSAARAGSPRLPGLVRAAGSAAPRGRASTSQALQPGSELGPRFRIESLIGQGGMGRVYRAYDKELGRVVALKVLLPELTSDPAATQRFKQELLLASKISHKNILRIHDLGEADGVKFISMAYVEGEDLHQLLAKQHPLPVDRATRVARQLCEALEAAHSEGVVHRDLKPQNILVGKDDHVYISDFGLAKSLEASLGGMTRTGAFLGTPRYMSPEQVEGHPVDHRTDLYALGLILYEMATGDVPFAGDSTFQVMYQRVKQAPKNPKLLNPDLPDYLCRIILRCLEANPDQRYQQAGEILRDLNAQHATPPRSVQITLPLLSRRAWLIGAGALVAVILAGVAIPPVRHFIFRRTTVSPGARAGIPRVSQGKYVAVLPFRVLGDQASMSYVADGLVEALSAKLFQLKDVHTASVSAIQKIRPNDPLEKVAGDLGVNLVVSGTIQHAGEKLRIIAALDDVAGGHRLWTQEFSGVSRDLLALEDQIYGKLIGALELKPSSEEMARSSMHPTENIEAYDLYLRGRNAMREQLNVGNVEAAIRFYEEALEKDPNFALAYTGLADASLRMYREKKDRLWAEKALSAGQQAQRIDDGLAEVHFALGSVYNATGRTAEAIAELKRAVKLAPNSDEGYRRLGDAYRDSGQKDEAVRTYQKAIEVSPYFWFNWNALGSAYYHFGENEEALNAFRRVTELEPDNAAGYRNLATVYCREGRWDECIATFQKSLELEQHPIAYANLGFAYFYLKRYADAAKVFEKAVQMNPSNETSIGNLADAYRWSGRAPQALETYDKAIALAYKDLQVNPRAAGTMGHLALYYAKKGDSLHALEFIRRARSIDQSDLSLIYEEAVIYTLADHRQDGLRALGEAFQKGYSVEEAKNDPELGKLQSRPEFAELLRRFGGKQN